jgi:hypothetical protein
VIGVAVGYFADYSASNKEKSEDNKIQGAEK